MQAFVTGGAGFLGYHLVKRLVAEDWEVTVFDLSTARQEIFTNLGVNFLQGSVLEKHRIKDLLAPGTDAVFHIAGNTSLWGRNNRQQTLDNVQGTQNMLEAARLRGVRRFIHTSSYTVYGFHQQPFTEQATSNAMHSGINYFISKAMAEKQVRDAADNGQDSVILNPANLMGPYDSRNWSQLFILIDRGKLPGAPPGRGSFAHVDDVAAAHLSAFHKGRSGENYLLGGVDLSYLDLIQAIGRHLGRTTPDRSTPGWLLSSLATLQSARAYLSGREPEVTPEKAKFFSGNLCCNDAKARSELNYQASSLQQMIESSANWLKSEGQIKATPD